MNAVRRSELTVRRVDDRSFNILLIEDNPDDADYIKEILTEDPQSVFRMEWVDHLTRGLDRLKQNGFDAVLLDLSLPDSVGLDTVARFRTHAPAAPVVVLTGLLDEATGIESIKRGVQEYLVKSENIRELLPKAIRYAVERAKTQAAQKELEKLKDDFIGILTHEIRSPLTVIKGALGNLAEGLGGPLNPKQTEMIEMAGRNAEWLNKIIQNVLSLSRMESGKAILNRAPVQVDPLLGECGRMFLKEAAEKKIEIVKEIPAGLPPIYADSDMILEVLCNLLSNAVRFARSKIWIRAIVSEQLRISVIDDGPGIPEQQISKLFDKYVQVGQTKKSKGGYKGTGLGLAICKLIVELHQGNILAENVPGLGAAFRVVLPVYNPKDAFEVSTRQAIEEAESQKTPLTLIVAAVRNMASLKSRLGEKGLAALLQTAEDRISSTLRREDRRLRLDERMVILAHTDLAGAAGLCQRIKLEAGGNLGGAGADAPAISFEFGLALHPDDGRTPWELLDKAIENMSGGAAA